MTIIHRYRLISKARQMVNHPEFQMRLIEALSDKGMDTSTQTMLGKLWSVSGTMAWKYRNGERLPGIETAIRIAVSLDICVEWLLSGREPKRPQDILNTPDKVIVDITSFSPSSQHQIKAIIKSFGEVDSIGEPGIITDAGRNAG